MTAMRNGLGTQPEHMAKSDAERVELFDRVERGEAASALDLLEHHIRYKANRSGGAEATPKCAGQRSGHCRSESLLRCSQRLLDEAGLRRRRSVGPARDHCGALASGRGKARGDLDPGSAIQARGAALSEFSATSLRPLSPNSGTYAIELFGLGVTYFVLAKIGLTLASIHPSASPIWPPTGLALAAVVVRDTGFGQQSSWLPWLPMQPPPAQFTPPRRSLWEHAGGPRRWLSDQPLVRRSQDLRFSCRSRQVCFDRLGRDAHQRDHSASAA